MKLALGIAAILCLDLGFAAYMSIADSGITGSVVLNIGNDKTGETAADDFVIERVPSAISSDENTVRKIITRRPIVDEHHLVTKTVYKREKPLSLQTAFHPSTTTIYYSARPRTEYPAPLAHYTQAVTTPDGRRKSERRSLIAAALPIVKKPYDLIKTLGSKMF